MENVLDNELWVGFKNGLWLKNEFGYGLGLDWLNGFGY